MAPSVLSVRVDSEAKASFTKLCEELGMTASVAVNMFVKQMLRERALPFVPTLEPHGGGIREESASGELSLAVLKDAIHRAARSYQEIRTVTLFGSRARGEARTDSDIDLRVACDEGEGFSLLRLSGFSSYVRELTRRDVDVVSAQQIDDALAAEIARDGVLLYERA